MCYDNDHNIDTKKLTDEIHRLKKQVTKLQEEKKALHEEYLNYMEYSELTILDLAVEIKKLKGINNTMSPDEFQQLFKECRLSEINYYSS